ncbi:hypothetical protein C8A05DRAFT_14330 [Staphylotrichum tortipilum]|uniref:Secreted protein n=1 Tax=Staphylotrichum tortipilum TaxID=2831512 RepID=A0AAN6RVK3_9PEZI|nr:hypothetical protein C8A05DRAFT_14330 [Staphylotrichum longicolle]
MRSKFNSLVVFFLSLRYAAAQINDCNTTDLACHDIMNSSQCIEQLILEKSAPITKEALVKCVEHEGTASSLPGAVKVRSCPASRGREGKLIMAVLAPVLPLPRLSYPVHKHCYPTVVSTAVRIATDNFEDAFMDWARNRSHPVEARLVA